MSEAAQRLKKRIRSLLLANDMTSADLARKLDLDSASVVPFTAEERRWNPGLETLERVSAALNVQLFELFANDESRKDDLSKIREELARLRQDLSPLPNLPTDVVEALARLKPGQVDGLRAILKGFGVLEKATGEPGSAAR